MTPELEALGLAGGTAAVVGAVGAFGTIRLARRSVTWATFVAPLVVVASIAAGIWVTARAMFLSPHDLALVSWLLVASIPIALLCGLVVSRAVREIDKSAAQAAADREQEVALAQTRAQMVTWASHDLKSPLAGIRVMAEALQDGVAPDPDAYHQRIRSESDRMARMVDDLLEMSRLQGPPSAGRQERLNLVELTRDVVHNQTPVASERGVTVEVQTPDSVVVRGDSDRLSRALTNVIRNAVLYTEERSTVTVRVQTQSAHHGSGQRAGREQDCAFVEVLDQCQGLSDDDLAHLFDPGWRGSAARTPGASSGTGVGLTMAQAIAQEAGGQVLAEQGKGQVGCRMTLRLPLSPQASSPG